jgi:hypothetical protein
MSFEGVQMQVSEKPKGDFYDRPDIVGSVKVLDVWASVKWHWKLGGQGIPPLDWIDMKHDQDVYVRFVRRGKFFLRDQREKGKKLIIWEDVERAKKPGFQSSGKLNGAWLLTLGVDALMGELGNPKGLHDLLIHRYPLNGPAARAEPDREFRKFRPPVIYHLCGDLRGKHIDWRIDQVLAAMERDFLERMARMRLTR